MGEVYVDVVLTNAIDAGLQRRKKLTAKQVRKVTVRALVDTGAVRLVLPPHIAEKLGLGCISKQIAKYADGRLEQVDLTEAVYIDILDRRTTDSALVLGDEVLIGQTVLETTDLLVDCRNHRLIPNPAHPNQPVMDVR